MFGSGNQNGFILLVVLFILLIIVGNNYPMGQQGGQQGCYPHGGGY